jgi:hypothetical protein
MRETAYQQAVQRDIRTLREVESANYRTRRSAYDSWNVAGSPGLRRRVSGWALVMLVLVAV